MNQALKHTLSALYGISSVEKGTFKKKRSLGHEAENSKVRRRGFFVFCFFGHGCRGGDWV